ncbi:prolipoprotein diacylglyceryl transferase [Candidatus Peregrinibacteria bacterium]|nr:MAG: prolipoprotein diacylglyceryl transferase [Candidatus Peregrinibacteria bacterium]
MIPILYESGFISIQTLWVFAAIAVLISSYLAIERLKRARVNFTLLIEHSTFILIWSLLVSRTLFFITNHDIYRPAFDLRTFFSFFSIWDQGLSFWGAIFGGGIVLFLRLRKSEESLSRWADALMVPLLVGLGIGALGAFLGGYAYGTPTELPWGVLYESFNVKYTVPIHPVQLYECLAIGLILVGKRGLQKKTSWFQKDGNSALYFAGSYSFICFFLEFLRGDDTLQLLGIRLTQIAFFFLTLLFAFFIWKRLKHPHHGSPKTL